MLITKILITGGTGFIGGELTQSLLELGFDVYSLQRYVTARFVQGKQTPVKTVFADLKEYSAVRKAVREVQPDAVIHLASISPVAYSYDHPHEVMETNLHGTINLVEACLHEVPHLVQFLFASTSETYGNGPSPKTEETVQNPNSPYAVSKLASEKYLLYLRDAYRFPVTILRPFNTYGRKDNTHFVVERTITQMLGSNEIRLGDPRPVRDFLHVRDHVNAYLTCLGNEKAMGEVFNFCTGRGISISNLVEQIKQALSFRGEVIWSTIPQRPLDIAVLVGDGSKANRKLGWKPQFTLEEGLRETIKFWKHQISESSK